MRIRKYDYGNYHLQGVKSYAISLFRLNQDNEWEQEIRRGTPQLVHTNFMLALGMFRE